MLNRRGFLRRLLAGAAGSVVAATLGEEIDVERLLWTPKPMIVVPGTPEWDEAVDDIDGEDDADCQFVTADWITQEVLRIFEKNLRMLEEVNRRYDSASFRVRLR